MAVLSLKTELDVAEQLLAKGWFPEEINSILVFPLPTTIFCHLESDYCQSENRDVTKATVATPTTIFRARQLLGSAGWLDIELDSLLKPYLCGDDAWAKQTIHTPDAKRSDISLPKPLRWVDPTLQRVSLKHYRRTMAIKRIGSLAMVISTVAIAVLLLG
ncbi:MAG: hypothetical protein F6K11_16200 [Leptolyngbya sp. SIO3F4]|nr:hypothetical protein [Leptolyngbya sp. SIO3F4]